MFNELKNFDVKDVLIGKETFYLLKNNRIDKSSNRKRKSLKKPRTIAHFHQNGRCYYCNKPMWIKNPSEINNKCKITPKQARLLQCTGEHLVSHSDGGNISSSSIVAACWFCNQSRHGRVKPISAEEFKLYVSKRINSGKWFSITTH